MATIRRVKPKMYVLELGDYFSYMENFSLEDQKGEIDSYNRLSPVYKMFMQWYFTKDFREVAETLNYRQNRGGNGVSSIIGKIRILNGLDKMPVLHQKRNLETIFESIGVSDMMILENALSKTLEDAFPNYNWEYMKKCCGIKTDVESV